MRLCLLLIDKARPKNKTYICRCDERLKTKPEESTLLGYTGFLVELEHFKIKTTLIDEMFASVMGEYVCVGVMKDYNLTLRNLRVSHTLKLLFIMNE